MEYSQVIELTDEIAINPEGEEPELLETNECSGDLYTLKVSIRIKGSDYIIFQDFLDDGLRFFRNPFGEDSIDKEENTPIFNKIMMELKAKGESDHSSAMMTPLVFDDIASKSYHLYMNNFAKSNRKYPLSRYISYFGINENDALQIANLLAREGASQKEKEMLAQYIYLLSPHSLFNEPIEKHYGKWILIQDGTKMDKDEFRKGLLFDGNKDDFKLT
jgi:hypothetical protein